MLSLADLHRFGVGFVLDDVAGQVGEHDVRRPRPQGQVAHVGDAVQGDGDGADGRGPVGGRDDQLVAVHFHAVDAVHGFDALPGGGGSAVEAGDDDVVAHAALEVVGGALGDQPAVVD